MKNTVQLSRGLHKFLVSAFLCLFMAAGFAQEKLPFTKGVNLLQWFESEMPNWNKYDEADFACFKSIGVDVIRLPIRFDLYMEPENTGKVNDIVLEKLDQICDWAEKYQIYLVIDNHSYNGEYWSNNPPPIKDYKKHLESAWTQLAQRYKDRSEYIIYEIVNEPMSSQEYLTKWVKVQQEIIDVIRTYDTKHTIVVTSANFSHIDNLVKMKPYKDPNLIYTFHFYESGLVTHQGATWMGAGFADINIPFPYDKSRLPKYKGETVTWNQLRQKAEKINPWMRELIEAYPTEGTAKFINNRIKKVADWAKKNKVRVLAGEMGIHYRAIHEDRIAWINATTSACEENNIPYCVWGVDGYFGFLKSGSGESFPEDIDKEILEAEGFSMPEESLVAKTNASIKSFPQKPYVVYDGLTAKGTNTSSLHVKTITVEDSHKHCAMVSYPFKQGNCLFFLPQEITSKVIENSNSFCISFAVKFTNSSQEFRLNLADTDEGEELPPWKITVPIKASDYKVGEWVTVEIPISKFTERDYAWSNIAQKSFEPQGKYDWARFESIYFDFDDWEDKNIGDIYIDDVVIKKK